MFEERYLRLKKQLEKEYEEILKTLDFSKEHLEENCLKLTVIKDLLDMCRDDLLGCYSDIEAVLSYEHPLMTYYEQYFLPCGDIRSGTLDLTNEFIVDQKRHLIEVYEHPNDYSKKEYEQATNFMKVREYSMQLQEVLEKMEAESGDSEDDWDR